MKMTIESTPMLAQVDGLQCRVWEGVTELGVKCLVFVPAIAADPNGQDLKEFDREMRELAVQMAGFPAPTGQVH